MVKDLTKVNKETPEISLAYGTIEVKQGDNAIHMTKTDVNYLKMLTDGKFEGSAFVSGTYPRTRYQLLSDGAVLATCRREDYDHDETVYLSPKAQRRIRQFRDVNSRRLMWDMDFRGRY